MVHLWLVASVLTAVCPSVWSFPVALGFTVSLWLCLASSPHLLPGGRHLPARAPACQREQNTTTDLHVVSQKGLCQSRTSSWWMSPLHRVQLKQQLMTALQLRAVLLPHPLPRVTTHSEMHWRMHAWQGSSSLHLSLTLHFVAFLVQCHQYVELHNFFHCFCKCGLCFLWTTLS